MFYVTTPSLATQFCKTRKEAAIAAHCSVGRIGEIAKSGKSSVTLRNGTVIDIVDIADRKKDSTYWSKNSAAPENKVQDVAALITRQARSNNPELFREECDAAVYEAYKEYFGADRDSDFSKQVLNKI